MTNTNKLKAKIIENGFTISSFAEELGMSKATLSMKINNKVKFSQNDIRDISKKINLKPTEIQEIFLT